MSCKECEEYQEKGLVAYYRWKNANIGLIGCPKHIKEILDYLNKRNKEEDKNDSE